VDSVEKGNDVGSMCVKSSSLCGGEWEMLRLMYGCDGLLENVDGRWCGGH